MERVVLLLYGSFIVLLCSSLYMLRGRGWRCGGRQPVSADIGSGQVEDVMDQVEGFLLRTRRRRVRKPAAGVAIGDEGSGGGGRLGIFISRIGRTAALPEPRWVVVGQRRW